jgi:release factor glutamine methyltransferase
MFDKIYAPEEDSFLLAEQVKKYAKGIVLDMGTGSGIQAEAALENQNVIEVVAVDLNPHAVKHIKKKRNQRIKAIKSDLFSKLKEKFDTIAFNPPYLPEDMREKKDEHSLAVCGGKKGYEILIRFFDKVSEHLRQDGIILLLFSSLTDKPMVDKIIAHHLFESELLIEQHHFFESIYVYKLIKSKLLNELEARNLKNINFFAKGKRGNVYKADYNGKQVAVKVESKDSEAVERIANEIHWLTELNKHNIGPKLLFSDNKWFVMEFVEGDRIIEFIKKNKKKKIQKVLRLVFEQLFYLDSINLDKEEMHYPHKHIIVTKKLKPVLIDFERANKTISPKNISQFVQFLMSAPVVEIFKPKGIHVSRDELIEKVKRYKNEMSKPAFDVLVGSIR